MNNRDISNKTILALDWLLSLFTEEQREALKIESNGISVSLVQQLTARWWRYEPFTDVKLVFQAKAIQILEAQKGWIEFINEIAKDNIFQKLLRPENYKEKLTKVSKLKGTEKKLVETLKNNATLTRNIGGSFSGTSGTNKAHNLAIEWDSQARERLDSMKLITDKKIEVQETGDQDDGEGAIDSAQKAKQWIDQQERLDQINLSNVMDKTKFLQFSDGKNEAYSKDVKLFDVSISQSTGASTSDSLESSGSMNDGVRRQATESTHEKIILANAINNIHNIDFMDVREKFFKKFDILFNYKTRLCQ